MIGHFGSAKGEGGLGSLGSEIEERRFATRRAGNVLYQGPKLSKMGDVCVWATAGRSEGDLCLL